MKIQNLKTQSGYVLLLTVLAFMGISGAVAVSFTQQAKQERDHERYLYNKRVLEEAKRALLQFAYNYPVTTGNAFGPGHLPCTDIDNDGVSDTNFVECGSVGRLPWANAALGINDLRDADGQRLWYIVSDSFSTQGSNALNSDTSGTLTIKSPAGDVMYDGSNPGGLDKYGIAAVIIAPGAVIARNGVAQDRSIGNADDPFDANLDTDPGIINADKYLDLILGTEDNATVTQSSGVDGFILGGSEYQSNDNVNDQFILITAEEVTHMAERAVLEAYRNAINDYQQEIWGATVSSYRYPWLNAHGDIINLNVYDAVSNQSRVGRVPFLHYYTDHDSHVVISDLQIDFDITLDSIIDNLDTDGDGTYVDAFRIAFAGFFAGVPTIDLDNANLSFSKANFDASADVDDDDIGTLVVETGSTPVTGSVVSAPSSDTQDLFFWDGCASCPQSANGWELCTGPSSNEQACARNLAGTAFVPFAGWSSHAKIRIRWVKLTFDMDQEFKVEFNYTTPAPPVLNAPIAPTATDNARFQAVFNGLAVTSLAVADMAETDANNFVEVTVDICEQDNDVGGAFNVFSLPYNNDDSGSAYCTLDLATTLTVNQFDITVDYYPDLPIWVHDDDWNDSILMAYAPDYGPDSFSLPPSCVTAPPCLTVVDSFEVITNDKASLFLSAGSIPDNVGDLGSMYEGENATPLDGTFAAHPKGGDDAMLIVDDS
ncbi:MAG: hypothetical protein GY896_11240 [Gammaproteobacteria bacterium]|nr:hypothetical protein [Gammaproteobacteria bacterium]